MMRGHFFSLFFSDDKMSCFNFGYWKISALFIPIAVIDNRFLLFIFLCRIYFKKAIFVTYKFYVDVGFLNR
jgi:hypothetical protein